MRELVEFAIEQLPALRLPSGLYCFDRPFGGEPRGESAWYSLMVALGLQRALEAGHSIDTDVRELFARCLDHRGSFTPGDVGLALWTGSWVGCTTGDDLREMVPDEAGLAALPGMEIAWLVIGLAYAVDRQPRSEVVLRRVLGQLHTRRAAASPLYLHDSRSRLRRHLPNFATEIYTLLALSVVAAQGLDMTAEPAARALADRLLALQLPNGGWPWLYDADRGQVVERFELYTVHQDAMAPMALLEIARLTDDSRYIEAAARGLGWSRGHNELGIDLLDRAAGFAHRSIRRRAPWNRAALLTNTLATMVARRPLVQDGRALEVNRTTRPYHLGWVLEAWAGRETMIGTPPVG